LEIKKTIRSVFEGATIADKLLFAVLVLLSLAGFIYIKKIFHAGDNVIIEVNGKPEYRLSINENAVIPVKGKLGITVVEIQNNKVRVKDSPCSDKICMHEGWIDKGAVICLPNRVIVFIGGLKNKGNDIDAITR
jgi:hypothetical protein